MGLLMGLLMELLLGLFLALSPVAGGLVVSCRLSRTISCCFGARLG